MNVGDRVRITGDFIFTHDGGIPDEGEIISIGPHPCKPDSNLTHVVRIDTEHFGEYDSGTPFAEYELEVISPKLENEQVKTG